MGGLRPRLAGEEKKLLAKRPTENAEAYQLYLQGLFIGISDAGGFQESGGLLQSSFQKDPGYACPTRSCRQLQSIGDAGYLPPSKPGRKPKPGDAGAGH